MEDKVFYFKCLSCSECFLSEGSFSAHTRKWHCKILVCEGQNPTGNDDDILYNGSSHQTTSWSLDNDIKSLVPSNDFGSHWKKHKVELRESSSVGQTDAKQDADEIFPICSNKNETVRIRSAVEDDQITEESIPLQLEVEIFDQDIESSSYETKLHSFGADVASNNSGSLMQTVPAALADHIHASTTKGVVDTPNSDHYYSLKQSQIPQDVKGPVETVICEKSFQCSWCKWHFSDTSALSEHKKVCESCKPDLRNDLHINEVSSIAMTNSKSKESPVVIAANDGKLFSCSLCYYRSRIKCNVIRHLRVHTGEKPFQCLQCERCFADIRSLAKHNKICPKRDERNEYNSGKVVKGLTVHYGTKSKVPAARRKKIYKCGLCAYRSGVLCNTKRHLRIHTGEKPFLCRHCGKQFRDVSAMSKHERICGTSLPRDISLAEHEADKMVTDIKAGIFTEAEVPAAATGALKLFKCSLCSYQSGLKGNVKRHAILHTGTKPFECLQCDRCFSDVSSLAKHKKICGKSTVRRGAKRKSAIMTSLSKIGRESKKDSVDKTDQPLYKCALCSYESTIHNNVKRHLRKHTEEKTFSCLRCDTHFNDVTALTRHKKSCGKTRRRRTSARQCQSCNTGNTLSKSETDIAATSEVPIIITNDERHEDTTCLLITKNSN